MKLPILLACVLTLTSCATTQKVSLKLPDTPGSKALLKECVIHDDAAALLNMQVSQIDLVILKTLTERASLDAKKSNTGEIHVDAFWDAMMISTKTDLETLMTNRMNLVKEAATHTEFVYTQCSSAIFTKDMIEDVCTQGDVAETRWCLTKFF